VPEDAPVPAGLLSLRLYYFASFAALGAYLPYFPRWLEARGVEGIAMGIVAGLLPAMSVFGPPFVGLLADALGLRGSLLRIATGGACLSLAALAAGAGRELPFAALFAAVLSYAVFRSPMVMLADVVAMERAKAAGTTYGEVRLWGSVGFLVAAFATGRLLDPGAAVPLPAVIAALLFVAFLSSIPLPARPVASRLPVAAEVRALLRAPSFAIFLAVSFTGTLAHSAYDLCFSLHLRDLGAASDTGLAWAAGVLAEVGLLGVADRLLARSTPPRLLALSLLGAAGRWALLATVRSVPLLLVLQPLHAVSFALGWVSSVAYVKARAPAHALAAAQGLFTAVVGAGSVVGMLAWGAIYRRAGGAAVFGAASAAALAGGAAATFWARKLDPPGAPS
jgi:PPP family 3-phenylpropionic acid transporter